MSINWSDASFLRMIAGGASKYWILTSCSVSKRSEPIQWQKSILPHAYFKVNLNKATSATMSGLFKFTNHA